MPKSLEDARVAYQKLMDGDDTWIWEELEEFAFGKDAPASELMDLTVSLAAWCYFRFLRLQELEPKAFADKFVCYRRPLLVDWWTRATTIVNARAATEESWGSVYIESPVPRLLSAAVTCPSAVRRDRSIYHAASLVDEGGRKGMALNRWYGKMTFAVTSLFDSADEGRVNMPLTAKTWPTGGANVVRSDFAEVLRGWDPRGGMYSYGIQYGMARDLHEAGMLIDLFETCLATSIVVALLEGNGQWAEFVDRMHRRGRSMGIGQLALGETLTAVVDTYRDVALLQMAKRVQALAARATYHEVATSSSELFAARRSVSADDPDAVDGSPKGDERS